METIYPVEQEHNNDGPSGAEGKSEQHWSRLGLRRTTLVYDRALFFLAVLVLRWQCKNGEPQGFPAFDSKLIVSNRHREDLRR
ncbi:hypothetical protein JAAARDRAFT_37375 [Jaapia argillacea MUCL 33604]|uniref:Uncharacterized protein n=1 Tax=Jaapia argillacea MUCL 33604 TaxID=933084 RepID=A0A067PKK4_9AGAM|nr:hypothetical protein JAAARDRAFT_37375 [Jaapia argillacea MUCL 33604]